MRGVDCGMCREGRPEELKSGSRIFAGQVSDAYLRREGWVRGYSVVIWRGRHASELHDLVSDELARYWSEVSRVGRALADHFRPAKLNYEVLGNSVPHVHTHIVPRYLDDPAPGRPLPFPDPRLPDQPEEPFQRDVASLRQILGHDPSGPDDRRSEPPAAGSPPVASQIATLLDLTRDLMEGLKKEIEPLDVEQLRWQPNPRANSIGVTVWHVARWLDMLAHRRLRGLDAADEIWLRDGWAERTGYDPRGVGLRGWGVVTGYTIEEVARIPALSADQFLAYLEASSHALIAALMDAGEEGLAKVAAGYGGRSGYAWVRLALEGAHGHLGEIRALRALQIWQAVSA